jgi:hypothetical protein
MVPGRCGLPCGSRSHSPAHFFFPSAPSTSLTVPLTNWLNLLLFYFSCILPVIFFLPSIPNISAVVSTVFGIIIGPYAIGIFDPTGWEKYDSVTLEFTRIVIAVQVMAAGVSLPRYGHYTRAESYENFLMQRSCPIVSLSTFVFCCLSTCCGQGTILIPGDGRGGEENRVRTGQCSRALDKVVGEGSPPPDLSLSRLFILVVNIHQARMTWKNHSKKKSLPRNKSSPCICFCCCCHCCHPIVGRTFSRKGFHFSWWSYPWCASCLALQHFLSGP